MSQTDDAIALHLPGGIMGAISLESRTVTMEGDAVRLDDQLLAGPVRINLMTEHFNVGCRGRQLIGTAQRKDFILER